MDAILLSVIVENAVKKAFDKIEVKNYNPKIVGGYESPEPGDLPEKGKEILASTYASCRRDGGDKEKCAKIAWGAVRKAGY